MSHSIDATYSVYDESFPKARIEHVCSACAETIAVGHRYASVAIVFDGRASRVKRCLRCQAVHEHLREIEPGEMWPAEKLDCGEEYREHWGKEPPPEIAALAFALPDELQRNGGDL